MFSKYITITRLTSHARKYMASTLQAIPDQEAVEGHREGPGVETPQSPFGQVVMEGEVDRGGSGLLGQHKSGVCQGEECRARGGGQGSFRERRRRGGARPTGSVTLRFALRGVKRQAVFSFVYSTFSFVWRLSLGAGDRDALLGLIISIWDRIWSNKTLLLSPRAAASRCHAPLGRM